MPSDNAVSSAAPAAPSQIADRPVRIGIVGAGHRGLAHVRALLDIPGVQIPALADVNEQNVAQTQELLVQAGQPKPDAYTAGGDDYRRLVERDDLDAVIATGPWETHTPVCVAAMRAGKYAATEVPAALTVDECWELVDVSEQTGMPCMLLENVCYYRHVLLVLNLIRQGLLGELVHASGGYMHDVRTTKIGPNGEVKWRGQHSVTRDANLYPTHPFGPIAWWTDIGRGDRCLYLVSMSSKSRGINHYVAERFGADHPNATRAYALGDVNTTLIKTARGLTITLSHDTQSPRPYDLILTVQGTNGIYSGTLDKLYIEGRSPTGGSQHRAPLWEDPAAYYAEHDHPMWRQYGQSTGRYAHGPADYMTLHQFVKAVRQRAQTPITVYDAATWSVVTPLTEQSVAHKSAAVDFPDFTRGKWQTTPPIEITP